MPANFLTTDLIRELIARMGDDPERPGLIDTPARVVRSWQEIFGGYKQDPKDVLKVFPDEAVLPYDEIIICKDIEFSSTCEHHLLPFIGTAHVGYIPEGKRIVGLSKMARLVEVFARRLQVQERLTTEIANAMWTTLLPKAVGVVIRAKHTCMSCRGVGKQTAEMVTSKLMGAFRNAPEARAEFLLLCGV